MNLKDLLSISGQSGLFRFVSQGRNGVIVENIESKKRMNAPATLKMSSLEDIAIYTEDEEIPLSKVYDSIAEKEKGGQAIDHKSDNEKLKAYMAEILPEYDRDRVYVSDIKKLINWYNVLQKNDMLIKEEPEKEESDKEGNTEEKASVKKEKADIKSAVKKEGVKKPMAKSVPKKPVSAKSTQKKTATSAPKAK